MSSALAATDIAENVRAVQRAIGAACARAGRKPDDVTLIAVSKTRPVEDLLSAIDCGMTHFGENYVQEGEAKFAALASARPAAASSITRHFIGHLQRNKARTAVEAFDIIHSVDSVRVADAIARTANRAVPVFAQVNIADEASKGGVMPSELPALLSAIRALHELSLLGLMVIPPGGSPEDTRRWFRATRELAHLHGLAQLSMGMTGDFEAAIEEGATHVRIGRAIFGERG